MLLEEKATNLLRKDASTEEAQFYLAMQATATGKTPLGSGLISSIRTHIQDCDIKDDTLTFVLQTVGQLALQNLATLDQIDDLRLALDKKIGPSAGLKLILHLNHIKLEESKLFGLVNALSEERKLAFLLECTPLNQTISHRLFAQFKPQDIEARLFILSQGDVLDARARDLMKSFAAFLVNISTTNLDALTPYSNSINMVYSLLIRQALARSPEHAQNCTNFIFKHLPQLSSDSTFKNNLSKVLAASLSLKTSGEPFSRLLSNIQLHYGVQAKSLFIEALKSLDGSDVVSVLNQQPVNAIAYVLSLLGSETQALDEQLIRTLSNQQLAEIYQNHHQGLNQLQLELIEQTCTHRLLHHIDTANRSGDFSSTFPSLLDQLYKTFPLDLSVAILQQAIIHSPQVNAPIPLSLLLDSLAKHNTIAQNLQTLIGEAFIALLNDRRYDAKAMTQLIESTHQIYGDLQLAQWMANAKSRHGQKLFHLKTIVDFVKQPKLANTPFPIEVIAQTPNLSYEDVAGILNNYDDAILPGIICTFRDKVERGTFEVENYDNILLYVCGKIKAFEKGPRPIHTSFVKELDDQTLQDKKLDPKQAKRLRHRFDFAHRNNLLTPDLAWRLLDNPQCFFSLAEKNNRPLTDVLKSIPMSFANRSHRLNLVFEVASSTFRSGQVIERIAAKLIEYYQSSPESLKTIVVSLNHPKALEEFDEDALRLREHFFQELWRLMGVKKEYSYDNLLQAIATLNQDQGKLNESYAVLAKSADPATAAHYLAKITRGSLSDIHSYGWSIPNVVAILCYSTDEETIGNWSTLKNFAKINFISQDNQLRLAETLIDAALIGDKVRGNHDFIKGKTCDFLYEVIGPKALFSHLDDERLLALLKYTPSRWKKATPSNPIDQLLSERVKQKPMHYSQGMAALCDAYFSNYPQNALALENFYRKPEFQDSTHYATLFIESLALEPKESAIKHCKTLLKLVDEQAEFKKPFLSAILKCQDLSAYPNLLRLITDSFCTLPLEAADQSLVQALLEQLCKKDLSFTQQDETLKAALAYIGGESKALLSFSADCSVVDDYFSQHLLVSSPYLEYFTHVPPQFFTVLKDKWREDPARQKALCVAVEKTLSNTMHCVLLPQGYLDELLRLLPKERAKAVALLHLERSQSSWWTQQNVQHFLPYFSLKEAYQIFDSGDALLKAQVAFHLLKQPSQTAKLLTTQRFNLFDAIKDFESLYLNLKLDDRVSFNHQFFEYIEQRHEGNLTRWLHLQIPNQVLLRELLNSNLTSQQKTAILEGMHHHNALASLKHDIYQVIAQLAPSFEVAPDSLLYAQIIHFLKDPKRLSDYGVSEKQLKALVSRLTPVEQTQIIEHQEHDLYSMYERKSFLNPFACSEDDSSQHRFENFLSSARWQTRLPLIQACAVELMGEIDLKPLLQAQRFSQEQAQRDGLELSQLESELRQLCEPAKSSGSADIGTNIRVAEDEAQLKKKQALSQEIAQLKTRIAYHKEIDQYLGTLIEKLSPIGQDISDLIHQPEVFFQATTEKGFDDGRTTHLYRRFQHHQSVLRDTIAQSLTLLMQALKAIAPDHHAYMEITNLLRDDGPTEPPLTDAALLERYFEGQRFEGPCHENPLFQLGITLSRMALPHPAKALAESFRQQTSHCIDLSQGLKNFDSRLKLVAKHEPHINLLLNPDSLFESLGKDGRVKHNSVLRSYNRSFKGALNRTEQALQAKQKGHHAIQKVLLERLQKQPALDGEQQELLRSILNCRDKSLFIANDSTKAFLSELPHHYLFATLRTAQARLNRFILSEQVLYDFTRLIEDYRYEEDGSEAIIEWLERLHQSDQPSHRAFYAFRSLAEISHATNISQLCDLFLSYKEKKLSIETLKRQMPSFRASNGCHVLRYHNTDFYFEEPVHDDLSSMKAYLRDNQQLHTFYYQQAYQFNSTRIYRLASIFQQQQLLKLERQCAQLSPSSIEFERLQAERLQLKAIDLSNQPPLATNLAKVAKEVEELQERLHDLAAEDVETRSQLSQALEAATRTQSLMSSALSETIQGMLKEFTAPQKDKYALALNPRTVSTEQLISTLNSYASALKALPADALPQRLYNRWITQVFHQRPEDRQQILEGLDPELIRRLFSNALPGLNHHAQFQVSILDSQGFNELKDSLKSIQGYDGNHQSHLVYLADKKHWAFYATHLQNHSDAQYLQTHTAIELGLLLEDNFDLRFLSSAESLESKRRRLQDCIAPHLELVFEKTQQSLVEQGVVANPCQIKQNDARVVVDSIYEYLTTSNGYRRGAHQDIKALRETIQREVDSHAFEAYPELYKLVLPELQSREGQGYQQLSQVEKTLQIKKRSLARLLAKTKPLGEKEVQAQRELETQIHQLEQQAESLSQYLEQNVYNGIWIQRILQKPEIIDKVDIRALVEQYQRLSRLLKTEELASYEEVVTRLTKDYEALEREYNQLKRELKALEQERERLLGQKRQLSSSPSSRQYRDLESSIEQNGRALQEKKQSLQRFSQEKLTPLREKLKWCTSKKQKILDFKTFDSIRQMLINLQDNIESIEQPQTKQRASRALTNYLSGELQQARTGIVWSFLDQVQKYFAGTSGDLEKESSIWLRLIDSLPHDNPVIREQKRRVASPSLLKPGTALYSNHHQLIANLQADEKTSSFWVVPEVQLDYVDCGDDVFEFTKAIEQFNQRKQEDALALVFYDGKWFFFDKDIGQYDKLAEKCLSERSDLPQLSKLVQGHNRFDGIKALDEQLKEAIRCDLSHCHFGLSAGTPLYSKSRQLLGFYGIDGHLHTDNVFHKNTSLQLFLFTPLLELKKQKTSVLLAANIIQEQQLTELYAVIQDPKQFISFDSRSNLEQKRRFVMQQVENALVDEKMVYELSQSDATQLVKCHSIDFISRLLTHYQTHESLEHRLHNGQLLLQALLKDESKLKLLLASDEGKCQFFAWIKALLSPEDVASQWLSFDYGHRLSPMVRQFFRAYLLSDEAYVKTLPGYRLLNAVYGEQETVVEFKHRHTFHTFVSQFDVKGMPKAIIQRFPSEVACELLLSAKQYQGMTLSQHHVLHETLRHDAKLRAKSGKTLMQFFLENNLDSVHFEHAFTLFYAQHKQDFFAAIMAMDASKRSQLLSRFMTNHEIAACIARDLNEYGKLDKFKHDVSEFFTWLKQAISQFFGIESEVRANLKNLYKSKADIFEAIKAFNQEGGSSDDAALILSNILFRNIDAYLDEGLSSDQINAIVSFSEHPRFKAFFIKYPLFACLFEKLILAATANQHSLNAADFFLDKDKRLVLSRAEKTVNLSIATSISDRALNAKAIDLFLIHYKGSAHQIGDMVNQYVAAHHFTRPGTESLQSHAEACLGSTVKLLNKDTVGSGSKSAIYNALMRHQNIKSWGPKICKEMAIYRGTAMVYELGRVGRYDDIIALEQSFQKCASSNDKVARTKQALSDAAGDARFEQELASISDWPKDFRRNYRRFKHYNKSSGFGAFFRSLGCAWFNTQAPKKSSYVESFENVQAQPITKVEKENINLDASEQNATVLYISPLEYAEGVLKSFLEKKISDQDTLSFLSQDEGLGTQAPAFNKNEFEVRNINALKNLFDKVAKLRFSEELNAQEVDDRLAYFKVFQKILDVSAGAHCTLAGKEASASANHQRLLEAMLAGKVPYDKTYCVFATAINKNNQALVAYYEQKLVASPADKTARRKLTEVLQQVCQFNPNDQSARTELVRHLQQLKMDVNGLNVRAIDAYEIDLEQSANTHQAQLIKQRLSALLLELKDDKLLTEALPVTIRTNPLDKLEEAKSLLDQAASISSERDAPNEACSILAPYQAYIEARPLLEANIELCRFIQRCDQTRPSLIQAKLLAPTNKVSQEQDIKQLNAIIKELERSASRIEHLERETPESPLIRVYQKFSSIIGPEWESNIRHNIETLSPASEIQMTYSI